MIINKSTLLLLIYVVLCFAQNEIKDPREAMIRHKQAYYSRAAELLKSSQSQETENQSHFDVRYYKLDMTINYDPNYIEASVTGIFTSLIDNLSSIELNLENSLDIDSLGGAAISYVHSNNLLNLTLNQSYSKNENVTLTVYYSGLPLQTDLRSFQFDSIRSTGSPIVWTQSEPYGARIWWPCKDSPRDKADSVDIIITVPNDQIVGSNGTLVSEVDNLDGTKTFHWHEQYPIATYLVSLVTGEYAHFQDYYDYGGGETMLLDYYVFPEQLTTAQSIFPEMHDYLDALSYYFGPYPFLKEKYGQASYNWGGAMEHQTLTSIGRVTPDWRFVYVHELGHQWFGDLVTCASWMDIWLNEGFASYSEPLYAEWAGYKEYPPGMDAYHAYMADQDYRYGGTIYIADTTQVSNIFNRIVYDKGSWVLHMLRGMMGDSVFFNVLKAYANDPRWAYGSVRTANFQEICEQKSGLDLDNFFNQWLYYEYYPEYRYSWDVTKLAEHVYTMDVTIAQIQTSIVYDMPIELVILFSGGRDTSIVVHNDQDSQDYTFTFTEEPLSILFDPYHWILCNAEPMNDQQFTKNLEILRMGPNPFPNAVSSIINIEILNWVEDELIIDIFDILGRKVKSIQASRNQYTTNVYWDGTNQNNVKVGSGVYFLRVRDKFNQSIQLGYSKKIIYFNK